MSRASTFRFLIRIAFVLVFALALFSTANAQRPTDPVLAEKFERAERLFSEASDLQKTGDKTSLEISVKKFTEALEIFKALGSRVNEAYTLTQLGYNYGNLNDFTKALESHSSAFTIANQIGNRSGEAWSLYGSALTYGRFGKDEKALEFYNRALPIHREVGDRTGEVYDLHGIGNIYSNLGAHQKALDYYSRALIIYGELGNKDSEASILNSMGAAHSILGENQTALELYKRALSICQDVCDRKGEAASLDGIGSIYGKFGETQKALDFYGRALIIRKNLRDRAGEALSLSRFGALYLSIGENQKGLDFNGRALTIFKEIGDRRGEGAALNNMGVAYLTFGENQKALELFNVALAVRKEVGDRAGEGVTLNNIGLLYDNLGEHEKALDLYNRSLTPSREKGDLAGELTTLGNIGLSYHSLGKHQKALEFYNQALLVRRKIGDRVDEAVILNNMAGVYNDIGDNRKALEFYSQALSISKEIEYRLLEGNTLSQIGFTYNLLGNKKKSLEFYGRALPIHQDGGDRRKEARTLRRLMDVWNELGNRRLAIFYGKQSVNVYQQLRSAIKNLDKDTRDTYLRSFEDVYRTLADLLLTEDRIAEAQAVQALLKEDEFKSFVRDASEAREQATLTPTDTERKALEEYGRLSDEIVGIGKRYNELGKRRNCKDCRLDDPEEKEYKELGDKLDKANEGFREFTKRLEAEFSKQVEDKTVVTPETVQTLQGNLRAAGPGVVLVSTYLLKDRYRVIVTTGSAIVDRKVEYKDRGLTDTQVKDKIIQFHGQLQNPSVDPRPLGKELYDIFVKPIENDLKAANGNTILWSLDGRLRYIPIGALSPDGKSYLAEEYRNVIVTLARQANLFTKPTGNGWSVLGAGVSKGSVGFSPLTSVPEELTAIVRNEKEARGAFNGESMLDEGFTETRFSDSLQQMKGDSEGERAFNVVHLATHFKLEANNHDSAMLLGDGSLLPLDKFVNKSSLSFDGVELVTLSACKTGVPVGEGNGREVEGLGMIAQQKGAKSVIASLWSVNDASTSLLMAAFYKLKKENPSMSKAEALQRAQLAMIRGEIKTSGKEDACRQRGFPSDSEGKDMKKFTCDQKAPFSHPNFWSPFVLIGNWR